MKKNMAKGLATALSLTLMASVVAPVGSVFAATPDLAKRYDNVYQGGSYKYTTKNSKGLTVKWTVTGTSKDSIKLASTTGTSNSIKVDTKGKKASTATVEARFYKKVKKNGKNVYQLVKKRIDNVTVKVSAKSVSINNKVESLKVNQEYDFNRTMTPSNATSKTYWTVTTKDGKETQDASVDKMGVFKASKAGEYVVTATSRNSANAKVRGTDSVTFKVVDAVVSARQTKSNAAEVELTSDVKVTKDDFKVFGANNVIFPVKEVKQEGKLVTLEFFGDLKQKDVYTVNYGDSKAEFTATDGVVVDIALNKTTVVAGEESEVKVQFKDANGVVVKEVGLSSTGKEEVKVETTTGYVTGDKLVLYKVGDKATVKATYHTYEYDNTTGKEKGVVERSFEVTAVEKSAVTVKESKYTIVKENDSAPNWNTSVKINTQLPKNDNYTMYIKAKGSDDKDIKYNTFESSDSNGLTIIKSEENKVTLRGNKTGTFYVLAKDDKGNVIATFPVTVVEEAKIASIVTDRDTIDLSATYVGDKAKVKVELKDQYGNVLDSKENKVVIEGLSKPDSATFEMVKTSLSTDGKYVEFETAKDSTKAPVAGTYKFKLVTSNNLVKVITVNVKEATTTSASVRIEGLSSAMEATVNDKTEGTKYTLPISVVGSNGVVLGKADGQAISIKDGLSYTGTVTSVEVKNSKGHIVYSNVQGFEAPTTGDAAKSYSACKDLIEVSQNKDVITVHANKKDAEGESGVFRRLPVDTYTITVKYDLAENSTTKASGKTVTTSFVVKDETENATVKQVKTESDKSVVKFDSSSTDATVTSLVNDAFEFTYQGTKVENPTIKTVYGHTGANDVFVDKVELVVNAGANKLYTTVDVRNSVKVNDTNATPSTDGGSGTDKPVTKTLTITATTSDISTTGITLSSGSVKETFTVGGTEAAIATLKVYTDAQCQTAADSQKAEVANKEVTFKEVGTYYVRAEAADVTQLPSVKVVVNAEQPTDITSDLATITSDGITGTLSGRTTGTVEFTSTGLDNVENASVVKDKITFTGATGNVTVTEASVTGGTLTLKLSGLADGTAENLKMNIAEGSGLKKSGKDVKATNVTVDDKRA